MSVVSQIMSLTDLVLCDDTITDECLPHIRVLTTHLQRWNYGDENHFENPGLFNKPFESCANIAEMSADSLSEEAHALITYWMWEHSPHELSLDEWTTDR